MADDTAPSPLQPLTRALNLIPVGLKEAALDSPTFRATALHFIDQIEAIERWLEGYVKAAAKLVTEVSSLESQVNHFLSQSMPPSMVSEAVLDHDYTLLAMRRYGEGAREFWHYTLRGIKKYDTAVVDPIKSFLNNELKSFKDARRMMEASQRTFDSVLSRYVSQSKAKEASSLREDAFQLHEARKAYLKASMDFCIAAPQMRTSLDMLIVKVFSEQWKEMRATREGNANMFQKWGSEMERVRGWSREMENSERAFKRELLTARRQIEESASAMTKPSRELEDYAASTAPYLGTGASTTTGMGSSAKSTEKSEKQGWLFQKTLIGKPARTVWSRRWFFVKNGIFGWLVQGSRSGGVEESERIGVLLCSVRPSAQEERRFCFEVKTKDTTIVLQAETQQELTEWMAAFDVAKRKALEDPNSTETNLNSPGVDPAFSISPPTAPEFAASTGDTHAQEETATGLSVADRAETGGIASRSSFDVSALPAARRIMSLEKEGGEGSRDHAARIIQKLDLHKRSTASPQLSQGLGAAGGIASLISASHNILPVGPGAPPLSAGPDSAGAVAARRNLTMPMSSLAPNTLANPPAPTNLSHTAVVISGERGVGLGRANGSSMPSGIMANLWGSSNWGYVNRLGDDSKPQQKGTSQPPSPALRATSMTQDDVNVMDGMSEIAKELSPLSPDTGSLGPRHRKTVSIAGDSPATSALKPPAFEEGEEYPSYYPLPLKAQQAQFCMLFPNVPRSEKVVLVFRATWNPNEQQEFPGRVYVTLKDIYFYSNHLGLVLLTGVSLASINEVTAAPGRDCDFVYLHLRERNQQDDLRRITVKIFLEPLRLLQRRLNFLVHNANAEEPSSLEDVLRILIKMEVEEPQRSSSIESWEDITYDGEDATPNDQQGSPQARRERNVKASLRIDGTLYAETARTGREVQKFKLPAQPVVYAPQAMQAGTTRDFNVSAKALFHVMFGDKSAVFQLLYCNRWADTIVQTAWTKGPEQGARWSRKFASQGHATPFADTQEIDIFNDHLCYVITNTKYPWRLPYSSYFTPTTKIVITHSAKSRCKLAIFQQITWQHPPSLGYVKQLIERQALNSLEADALDLTNVAMDQVAKLGSQSKTNKAIEIFGNIGQQISVPQIDVSAVPNLGGSLTAARVKQRTRVSLMRLVTDDALIRLLRMLGMLVDVLVAVGKQLLNVCTAHTLLVVLLAFSALYNGWYGYRDGISWYHERSARGFMARVGVRPDPMLSKAVYLSDIEELIATSPIENNTLAALAPRSDLKTCRSTFGERLTSSTSVATVKPMGDRLHRTRDSLARYRHDLLVALRVVNRVERDVVAGEFENWVRAEERKCARVEGMLRQQRSTKGGESNTTKAADYDAELGAEFTEYCQSCRSDLSRIETGTGVM